MQKSVLCDILKKIKPSKEEIRKVNSLAKEITNTIKVRDAQIMLGGSIAKDTWLHGMHDIDIFVAFNYFFALPAQPIHIIVLPELLLILSDSCTSV